MADVSKLKAKLAEARAKQSTAPVANTFKMPTVNSGPVAKIVSGDAGKYSGKTSYATGNNVYRGGSSAPTSGPVDPTGYKERDATAKRGSGAALRKLYLKKRAGKGL